MLVPLTAAMVVAGCGAEEPRPRSDVDLSAPVVVTFEALGSAKSIDVVLVTGDGRVELTDRAVPLGRYRERTTSDPLNQPTEFLGPVSVDVPALERVAMDVLIGSEGGSIECRILVDGKVIDSTVADGPGATARCAGRVPAPRS
ncbi:hypothetical protein [Blastococcus sp. CCUG 61487]|uniref:hypothetical protein n=1 Tax=Blastococcus sp. CCUG 61487 TaxID=1840703 RepID=UPI0010BF86BF|nr:hypothetical protein [Blastococcus sp. CCUG 61487]TKJ31219.1 hypothetical protein A6V29_18535 [Blastococcus sp. CCUG 61487]